MERALREQQISRRQMLKLTAGTAVGVTLSGTAFFACSDERVAAPAPGPSDSNTTPTVRPVLPIPERLEGSFFNLDMRPGEREFLPGLRTLTRWTCSFAAWR